MISKFVLCFLLLGFSMNQFIDVFHSYSTSQKKCFVNCRLQGGRPKMLESSRYACEFKSLYGFFLFQACNSAHGYHWLKTRFRERASQVQYLVKLNQNSYPPSSPHYIRLNESPMQIKIRWSMCPYGTDNWHWQDEWVNWPKKKRGFFHSETRYSTHNHICRLSCKEQRGHNVCFDNGVCRCDFTRDMYDYFCYQPC